MRSQLPTIAHALFNRWNGNLRPLRKITMRFSAITAGCLVCLLGSASSGGNIEEVAVKPVEREPTSIEEDHHALFSNHRRLPRLLGSAQAENLYGTTWDDFAKSPDLRAHPRSVATYRRAVPVEADIFGVCRNAGDVGQCVWRLNGHQYPAPPLTPWAQRILNGR
jgi:hypothetical protein